jgi:hypothetical protein
MLGAMNFQSYVSPAPYMQHLHVELQSGVLSPTSRNVVGTDGFEFTHQVHDIGTGQGEAFNIQHRFQQAGAYHGVGHQP